MTRLANSTAVSILLHLLLFLMLQAHFLAPRTAPPMPPMLDVDLLPALPPPAPKMPAPKAAAPPAPPPVAIPESGIVPMPDEGEEKPNPDARYLSDRDNVVERQTVKRGKDWETNREAKAESKGEAARSDPPPPARAPAPREPAPPPAPAPRAPDKLAALPKLDQLLPQAGDFAAKSRPGPEPTPATGLRREGARDLLRGKRTAISSHGGVAAYLPSVQEGDITLLNTKASRFAPFVRRVASRVFEHLEIRLRQEASAMAAGNGREYAEVEAIMSKDGQFVEAVLKERTSQTKLAAYRVLLATTSAQVFFDRNPPAGAAAEDGRIHFILMVDLAVMSAPDPSGNRRGSAFEGIAGVGLK